MPRPPRKRDRAKPPRDRAPAPKHQDGPIRLQRFLAQAGVASRRACEELMREGRVAVDGEPATEPGVRVDPERQRIEVDGTRIRPARFQYFMVHKPAGILSTSADPGGRSRVIDLIPTDQRVYTVGRLDKSSEGLILVTNDGELANRLTHPRYGVPKTYQVTVAGSPGPEDLQALKRGVHLAEGLARVADVRIRKRWKTGSDLVITLNEGRNREIRRLLARLGHKVLRLKRIAIGPLRLADMPVGSHRRLEHFEIEALRRASARARSPKPPGPRAETRHRAGEPALRKSRTPVKGARRAGAAKKKVVGKRGAQRQTGRRPRG